MPLIDDPETPGPPGDGARRSVLTRERAGRRPTRILLLACLPAVAVGLLIRVWVMHTSLLSLNSDEGITGLQAFEVLDGRFRLVVAGNEYGATTESYLMAPILHFWTGVWPLRVMATALSALAAYALYRLARPFLDRTIAATLALIGWTTSGAFVLLWSRAYMGYNTGFIAQVIAIALACHAIRNPDKLARTAVLAGFAAGFATWSHPMFGVVAVLALIAPSVYHWRRLLTWWLPAAAGGVLGVLPWLLFIAQNGWPTSALATVPSTYEQRVVNFFTELLPRLFGLLRTERRLLAPVLARDRGGDCADRRVVDRTGAARRPPGRAGGTPAGCRRAGLPVPRGVQAVGVRRRRAVRTAVAAHGADGARRLVPAAAGGGSPLAMADRHRADDLGAGAVRAGDPPAGRLAHRESGPGCPTGRR